VTSLLVGTAIDRKLIAGPKKKCKCFLECAGQLSAEWEYVSIGNRLAMSSGISWT
jgi:hypothetical protein